MRTGCGVLLMLAMTVSGSAFAKGLECDQSQKQCMIDNARLSIGDKVGVFNGDDELVARGEVTDIDGERRAVRIERRYGPIQRGYRLALLGGRDGLSASSYRIHREPGLLEMGASLGVASVAIGEGAPGAEASGYAAYRVAPGLRLLGRFVYETASGDITRYNDNIVSKGNIAMQGIGLLAGGAYTWREGRELSFRGEAGLGMMQVTATVDGDAGAVNDGTNEAHVKNGAQVFGRWSIGARYRFSEWSANLDFAESLVGSALANMVVVGLSRDIH